MGTTGDNWDNYLYDTAIVIYAMLHYSKIYQRELDKGLLQELRFSISKSLNWMANHINDSKRGKDIALATFVYARNNHNLYNKTTTKFTKTKDLELLSSQIIRERELELARHIPVRKTIHVFSDLIENLGHTSGIEEKILNILPQEIHCLEETYSTWGDAANQSLHLAAYIRAINLLAKNTRSNTSLNIEPNNQLIIESLYAITAPNNYFANGSIYHDLYATNYFALCLIDIYNYWHDAEKTIATIYDELLSTTTEQARLSAERGEILRLAREKQALESKIVQTNSNRMRILWFVAICYIIYTSILTYIFLPVLFPSLQADQNISLVLAMTSVLAPLVIGFIRKTE